MADQFTDTERLDWLEREANEPGGILLHDGSERGRKGIGLRPGFVNRTLRQAIDSALHYERGSAELKASGDGEPVAGVTTCPRCKQPAANLFRTQLPGDELDTTHCGCLYAVGVALPDGEQR